MLAIAAAIAALVILAIDLFIALWAQADPIIEDIIGPTVTDLVQLTSTNFPMPLPSEHITPHGLKVKVTPLDKVPGLYREKREYTSDEEESRYEIVLPVQTANLISMTELNRQQLANKEVACYSNL